MRNRSLAALIILVPIPSLGALAAMQWWPQTALGTSLFLASKILLFGLPLLWLLFIDQGRPGISPMRKGGLFWGFLSGMIIFFAIVSVYILFGDRLLDITVMQLRLNNIGLGNPMAYLGFSAYWILVNSVLEEFVWRWFVVIKCQDIVNNTVAVPLSALFFTIHHVFALNVYMSGWALLLCSVGVFSGGLIWSFLYAKFESIWPAYLSHALVDLSIFLIGAHILFY